MVGGIGFLRRIMYPSRYACGRADSWFSWQAGDKEAGRIVWHDMIGITQLNL